MKKIFILFMLVLTIIPGSIKAEEIDLASNSKSAIMLEVSTGEIIFEKNAHEKLAPASMTKMMSMLLFVEAIENGIMSWDEIVTVSENASSMGGSQILLETGEKMQVKDLFKGVAVASGNDAVVALAEKMAGTEEAFIVMMNNRAKELGLENTNFKNPHGLDTANHYSTAYDMAMIAKELVSHEEVLKYTAIYEDYLRPGTDRKIWLVNTNKLVRFYDGVDGLKTGYTKEAGYCLTATAKKNNMRLITVVMGVPDSGMRNSDVSSMLDYGFAQYEVEQLLSQESNLGRIEVDKGTKKYVDIIPLNEVTVLNKKIENKKNATYEVTITNKKAPLKKGDIVGELSIIEDNNITRKINVTVKDDIPKANLFQLYLRYLEDIIKGDINL